MFSLQHGAGGSAPPFLALIDYYILILIYQTKQSFKCFDATIFHLYHGCNSLYVIKKSNVQVCIREDKRIIYFAKSWR